MRLTNEVVLPAPPEAVFALINDVQRIAPHLPGATLEGRTDDSYRGRVRVEVGPISAAYQGVVRFLEVDEPGNRLVLGARGRDEHGIAEARVAVQVRPHDAGSVLALDTDLVIRGEVARFGRGALADISQQLVEQFAANISDLLAEPAQVVLRDEASPHRENYARQPVVVPMLKKAAPVAVALVVGIVVGRLLGARRS
ncbi:SRPBCC family protein [Saccharopolyspora sp. 5N708]|uniref:SRPBCC family protein n=1 Tax=Saccharopolyspora sp. 5N708 TaxID=3457424 RepID=UPI003FD35FEB